MKKFISESMYEISSYIKEELKDKKSVQIEVLNPNNKEDLYAGEKVEAYIYRSYKAWSDLAQLLFCKMYVKSIYEKTILIEFESLNKQNSFHKQNKQDEKYGRNSIFFRINKNEEPAFLLPFIQALENVKIKTKKRVLNLGVNKADEFDVIKQILTKQEFDNIDFFGVDYSKSAIEYAKKRFESDNCNFFVHDIKQLKELALPKADLLISIGTLQSVSSNFKTLFMDIVQNHLEDKGSIILGFPNCRWLSGEMIYGAKAVNYSFSEQSVLYNDVIFCKKYLQQKKYRVTLTGKDYLFLTATSIKD